MARWLSDPLVIEWWHGLTCPFDEARVYEHYFIETDDWVRYAIVELEGEEIGFQEWYPLESLTTADRAKHEAIGFAVEDAYGMDQFVGESALHGRGIGTLQVRAMSSWLLDTCSASRVGSAPVVENGRSIRVLEKAGFTVVGVLPGFDELDGEWRDCLLMERRSGMA